MASQPLPVTRACWACGGEIDDPGQGVAFLSQAEMRGYRERQQQLQQLQYDRIRDGGLGLMSYDEVALTEKASWQLAHAACLDATDAEVAYRIALADLDDPATATDWLCHLMEQEWPAVETDFAVFVRRHFLSGAPGGDARG